MTAQEWAVTGGTREFRDGIGYAAERVLIAGNLLRDVEIIHWIGNAEAMHATIVVLSSEFEPGVLLLLAASLHYCATAGFNKNDGI